jgi:hypothetical protein
VENHQGGHGYQEDQTDDCEEYEKRLSYINIVELFTKDLHHFTSRALNSKFEYHLINRQSDNVDLQE